MPQVSAADLRSAPSSTIARASIRRAAEPSFSRPAAARRSLAVKSSRVIPTAPPIDAAPLPGTSIESDFPRFGNPKMSQKPRPLVLYRWFVGLSPDAPVWDPTTFTKNRDRLQNGEVFKKFMTRLLNHPQVKPLLSDEHFSVDGTLIEAWASQKSFPPSHAARE